MTRAEAKFTISNYEFGHVPHKFQPIQPFFVDMGLSLKTNVSSNKTVWDPGSYCESMKKANINNTINIK